MSELSYAWWPYVRNIIRRKPLRDKTDRLDRVPAMENAAVHWAVDITNQMPDGKERLELIRLTYWRRNRYTLQRAAMDIPTSYSTARRWNYEFFLLVAEAMGLYDPPEE